jgi:hypothetical protein
MTWPRVSAACGFYSAERDDEEVQHAPGLMWNRSEIPALFISPLMMITRWQPLQQSGC